MSIDVQMSDDQLLEYWRNSRYFTPGSRPIAPVESSTTWVDAGVLTIGIEPRVLTSDMVVGNLTTLGVNWPSGYGATQLDREFEDGGLSFHVADATSGFEHLRFDCFAEDPHYHYIVPGLDGVIKFALDPIAHGDAFKWVIRTLRNRIRLMLTFAGGPALAAGVDDEQLGTALEQLSTMDADNSA